MGPSPVWIPEAGTRIEAAGGRVLRPGATDCTASPQLGFPHGNSSVCWIFCQFVEPRPFESPLERSSGEAMFGAIEDRTVASGSLC